MTTLPSLTSRPEVSKSQLKPARPKVELYGTQSCGYCKQARAYLHQRGIGFTDLDIETNASARSDYRQLNGQGVPIILAGHQRLDGYSEVNLARLLGDAGY